MDLDKARRNMVNQQIRPWGVSDASTLELLSHIRREDFAPTLWRNLAFADMTLPLGEKPHQIMLEPKMEARFLEALAIKPTDKVLEIGAGSGYMAALLAAKAEYVVSVEIDANLAGQARENLRRADVNNAMVEIADGSAGFIDRAPYDAIVISGGVPEIPPVILRQLRSGGRLVAVVGQPPTLRAQYVRVLEGQNHQTEVLFETCLPYLENFSTMPAFLF
ncbi:MAG: protein-L-isoaspartate O-methyltransferase [Zoogloeaceae bacterium]|jgi:protein-L-isoaspartate(D-aspartate) O-methyltransferase|nr:protein-L-isoaspartate O-methyltransferase [Zoogloeaceae bacterium]